MQMCQELAFNPIKLVESLKLRTTEQQDAQECVLSYRNDALLLIFISRFSKLFMAHLDSEFQKQSDPTLKSLIANQVCVISSVMNHHRPSVVSRETGLHHSLHAVSQQVRKRIRIFGNRSEHCRMVYIIYVFVQRLTS